MSRSGDAVRGTTSAVELRAAVAQAQARKAALAASLREADAELAVLARQLTALEDLPAASQGAPTAPAAKIAMFTRLFRGRTEVWPRLWTNNKTGRKGYAPVCGNDWRPGLCGKPKVKCGACQSS